MNGRPDRHQFAAARVWAAERMPYLASALFAADIRAAPDSGTIAVDRRWHVLADPEVASQLSVAELGALLLHLIGHLLRDHADRAEGAGATQHQLWNACADAEVNDDLPAAVPLSRAATMPADLGQQPHRLTEDYYAAISGHPRPRVDEWDCGSGADGKPRPGDGQDGIDPSAGTLLQLSVAAEIQRAAREPGTVPAGWQRWAEALLPTRVDWRRLLAAEIRRAVSYVAGRVDYSYRRPSRRGAAALPAILPTLIRPVPEVAVVCDTSGSMTADLLEQALVEVEGILTRGGLPSGSLRVLAVDTTVHAVRRVSRASQVMLTGGGGTNMGAGIEAAAALKPRPSIVVVLTDGYTPWPIRPPREIRVVVGLLNFPGMPIPDVPGWARSVVITDAR
ncbi:MAG TPA: VWA-like domain-containing protein [Frankiaceae bacterium]|jgi:predicted metal-dependent peptidase|nr:VWA-like domain-containing protein [Frankiaceae bacterium]